MVRVSILGFGLGLSVFQIFKFVSKLSKKRAGKASTVSEGNDRLRKGKLRRRRQPIGDASGVNQSETGYEPRSSQP